MTPPRHLTCSRSVMTPPGGVALFAKGTGHSTGRSQKQERATGKLKPIIILVNTCDTKVNFKNTPEEVKKAFVDSTSRFCQRWELNDGRVVQDVHVRYAQN